MSAGTYLILHIDQGFGGQEKEHHVRVPLLGGQDEGGDAVLATHVDVCLRIQQSTHHAEMSELRCQEEGCGAALSINNT